MVQRERLLYSKTFFGRQYILIFRRSSIMRYIVSLAVLPVLAARCGPDAGRTGASLKRHPIPVSSGSRKLPETGEPVGIYGFIPRIPTVLCSPATCPPAILPMTAAGHTDPSTIPTGDFRGCITSAASISAGKPPISDMPEQKATGCSKQRTEEKAGRGCPPPPSKESSTGNLHAFQSAPSRLDPSNPDCVWAGTRISAQSREPRETPSGAGAAPLLRRRQELDTSAGRPAQRRNGAADSDVRAAPRSDSCCNGRWNLCKQGRRKNVFRNDERAPGRHDLFRHRRHD